MSSGVVPSEPDVRDIKVFGSWNFTLQEETPLYWLRCGPLERYLLRFEVRCSYPCVAGLVVHTEVDSAGEDGISFWMERDAAGNRQYFLGGNDLESAPVVTRSFKCETKDIVEEIEVLVQGFTGCIFLQNRKVRIRFRCRRNFGSIAFYNSTKMAEPGQGEVHFSDVKVTALQGMLERIAQEVTDGQWASTAAELEGKPHPATVPGIHPGSFVKQSLSKQQNVPRPATAPSSSLMRGRPSSGPCGPKNRNQRVQSAPRAGRPSTPHQPKLFPSSSGGALKRATSAPRLGRDHLPQPGKRPTSGPSGYQQMQIQQVQQRAEQKRFQDIEQRRASTYKQIFQLEQRLANVGAGPQAAQRREAIIQELEALDADLRQLQNERDSSMTQLMRKDSSSTTGMQHMSTTMDDVLNPQRLVDAVLGSMSKKAKEAKLSSAPGGST